MAKNSPDRRHTFTVVSRIMPAFIFPPLRSGGGFCLLAVTLLVVTALPASGQDAPDPDAAATMRWGPVSLKSTIALSNVGVDSNVFLQPDALNPQPDFTLTFTPNTNIWVRMGRTWIDGMMQVDWVYFNRYASERGTNSRYKIGVSRGFNRLQVSSALTHLSTRDRPTYEIDARSQRFERTVAGEITYRALSKTSVGAKAQNLRTTYDKDAIFLGKSLPAELNRTTVTKMALMRHTLTPLTTISLEAGRENERFDTPTRNIDYTRIVANLMFEQSALVTGTASVGLRYIYPWNQALPDNRMVTGAVNLTYRVLGSTRLMIEGSRDIQHSVDADQPMMTQTGMVYSAQQQIYGPFDVLGRIGRATLGFHDRIDGVVAENKRRESIRTLGGGAGYRLGADKRVGFTLDYVRRSSARVERQFHGLRYGISVTYER